MRSGAPQPGGTVPITWAQANLGALVRWTARTRERTVITNHGIPAAALISAEELAYLEDATLARHQVGEQDSGRGGEACPTGQPTGPGGQCRRALRPHRGTGGRLRHDRAGPASRHPTAAPTWLSCARSKHGARTQRQQPRRSSRVGAGTVGWKRVPVGLEAVRWATRGQLRKVLLVVHNVTSATRLLDVVPLFRDDLRVQLLTSWTESSPFDDGVAELLARIGLPVLPWKQALETPVDLAVSASFGGQLNLLSAKLAVLSHGVGYNKRLGTPDAGRRTPDAGRRTPDAGVRALPAVAAC
jgi:prevent-host-death family protein